MRRNLFLMLTLFVLSAASANAQVLIGADDRPDSSAVLELRSAGQGLLLPQVKLENKDDVSQLANPEGGMLVCNLNGALQHGVYYWDGEWTLLIRFEE
jgi:hypothetical protein